MGWAVRGLGSDDWQTYRAIRLDALATDPSAFGSTWAREVEFTEQQWRDGIEPWTFTVELDGRAVGVIGGRRANDCPETMLVLGAWVRPEARGCGIAAALLGELCEVAARSGMRWLRLWVTEQNRPALRLYERWGFVDTGEREALLSDPSLSVVEMVRPVTARSP